MIEATIVMILIGNNSKSKHTEKSTTNNCGTKYICKSENNNTSGNDSHNKVFNNRKNDKRITEAAWKMIIPVIITTYKTNSMEKHLPWIDKRNWSSKYARKYLLFKVKSIHGKKFKNNDQKKTED